MQSYHFVLIHGWGGSNKSLLSLAQELQKLFSDSTFTCLDLPGFGENLLAKEFHLKDYVDYVHKAIQKDRSTYPDKQMVLIGHSVGGKILASLAATSEISNCKLVLINASAIRPNKSLKKQLLNLITLPYRPVKLALNKLGLKKLENLLQKGFYKFIVGTRDYTKLNDNPILKETFKNLINEYLTVEELSKIKLDTLVVWGELDEATPLWMGKLIHESIKNSNLVVVPGATHGLPLKQPEVTAKIIKEFINTNEI